MKQTRARLLNKAPLSLLALAAAVIPPVQGECWLRSDGTEICTHEAMGWMVVWWIWLVVLVIAGTAIGYCDCRSKRPRSDKDHDLDVGFVEPLLDHDQISTGEEAKMMLTVKKKPIYRYLD